MQDKISQLIQETLDSISSTTSERELFDLRVKVLGKSGSLTALLKGMKDVSAHDRPALGKLVNDARDTLDRAFDTSANRLHILETNNALAQNKIDVTLDRPMRTLGTIHPLNIVSNRIVRFFVGLGFCLDDSPEIETEYYNFTALNVPANHPARDMQDTFWINDNILLRSQTSNGQIRTMQRRQPPIKMLSVGRVYRADEIDATHSPCFHQIEGMVVDQRVAMGDLKGILSLFLKDCFGSNTVVRFRPSFFPFTEPSVEVDASCPYCSGKGCRICKGTGYIEILGAGLINHKVLQGCDIDCTKYSGFAFGMGLERITNILYEINDMRLLYDNDIRFLRQFE